MTDIVERLRNEQECGNCCGTFTGVALMREAADEIERLRLVARSHDLWHDKWQEANREIKRLRVKLRLERAGIYVAGDE